MRYVTRIEVDGLVADPESYAMLMTDEELEEVIARFNDDLYLRRLRRRWSR